MKHLKHCLFLLIFFSACGPELQTITKRDEYNRIIMEAELKGGADTLWHHLYTYHQLEMLSTNDDGDSTSEVDDLAVNDSGGLTWGEEPEEIIKPEPDSITTIITDSSSIPLGMDTTKKSYSKFVKGIPAGEWKEWHPNGNLKSTYFYTKGKIDGLYSSYNSAGDLTKTETFVKGLHTGPVKDYINGTILVSEKTFKKDSLDGAWTTWHLNGLVHVVREFKNGIPKGNWIFTDENSEWMREEQYGKGVAHGIWSFYDSVGVKVFQYYTKGELIAEYNEAKWPNDQIKEIPEFKNGLPHGTWTGNWPDGSTRYTLEYKNGKKHGNELKYDSLGVLLFEVKYDKGLKDGIENEYFSNGNLNRSAKYKDGKLNGKTELFNILGVKLETIVYKDSLKSGYHIHWWPNGQEHQRFTYDNNILTGKYEEWDSLGIDIVKGNYSEDKRHNKWFYFDNEGLRKRIVFFDLDSIITNYDFKYFPNGQIMEEPGFNDQGMYHGKWEAFFATSETWKVFYYKEGKKDKTWTEIWDSTFVNNTETNYLNDLKNGPYLKWNVTGNQQIVGQYTEDKKDLLWSYWNEFGEKRFEEWRMGELYDSFEYEYYSNGQVKEEPSYKNGRKHGEWVRYFPDGTIRGASSFKSGIKDGLWIDYYRPEQVAFQGNYKAGQKDGKWEWFWLNRTLMSKVIYQNDDIISEECYDRKTGSTRDCSKVFSPESIYYK